MRHSVIIPETWDDVLMQVLWDSHIEATIGARFVDAYAETYNNEGMDMLLSR